MSSQAAEPPLPFGRYPDGGQSLLGRPAQGDGTSRMGYGASVMLDCGTPCAYCDLDLGANYEAWLGVSVDHVVPRMFVKLGWPDEWIEDRINHVTACRACNEFLNGYRVKVSDPPETLEAFLDIRDEVFRQKRRLAQSRHLVERERFATWRSPGTGA